MSCKLCNVTHNDFVALNSETVPYSGLEIAFNRKGMLRIRYFNDEGYMVTQDIVNIQCCPMCGHTLLPAITNGKVYVRYKEKDGEIKTSEFKGEINL